MEVSPEYLLDIADRALSEDVESGDITTLATIPETAAGIGRILSKEDGIISGLDIAALIFYRLDSESEFVTDLVEGSKVSTGDTFVKLNGKLGALLTGERTALNFLMHLSGIATMTTKFVSAIKGTHCKILDTRKTRPGLRLLEKRAVSSGGGLNHRIGLYDMILIKNNHIDAAGSFEEAVKRAIDYRANLTDHTPKLEVETRTLDEVRQAMHLAVDRIMLDNFSVMDATAAVKLIRSAEPEMEIELSGSVRLSNVHNYAETGVDFISVGAITHSASWLDMSMQIERK